MSPDFIYWTGASLTDVPIRSDIKSETILPMRIKILSINKNTIISTFCIYQIPETPYSGPEKSVLAKMVFQGPKTAFRAQSESQQKSPPTIYNYRKR